MAGIPTYSPFLLEFWDEVCKLATNYAEVDTLNTAAKARYKLINVLWNTQRDEILTMLATVKTDADAVIDAVRGATPRPTLSDPVVAEQNPIYPLEFEAIPPYSAVTKYSYSRADFDDPRTPTPPLPLWWYIGANLYRMVLRGDTYLTTPLETVSGVNLGVWGASMYYGLFGLHLLHTSLATAETKARTDLAHLRSILNEKSRGNR